MKQAYRKPESTLLTITPLRAIQQSNTVKNTQVIRIDDSSLDDDFGCAKERHANLHDDEYDEDESDFLW